MIYVLNLCLVVSFKMFLIIKNKIKCYNNKDIGILRYYNICFKNIDVNVNKCIYEIKYYIVFILVFIMW